MPVRDGSSCPGCGLANYAGLCPHCLGNAAAYEHELVPPFPSIAEQEDQLAEQRREDEARQRFDEGFAEYEESLRVEAGGEGK
jgi:hypothetical protein